MLDVRRKAFIRPKSRGNAGRFLLSALVVASTWMSGELLGESSSAAAQAEERDECPEELPQPLEVTPASGASGVSLDSPIRIRYTDGYFAEHPFGVDPLTSISVSEDGGAEVEGTVQILGDNLYFIPSAPLLPSTSYVGTALGGGAELRFRFRTGTLAQDNTPPAFGNFIDTSSTKVGPTCGAPDGGYRIDVRFDPASDDGSPGSIEYLLFLTRGPEVMAPQLRATRRNFVGEITMTFVLTPEEAVSPVCVAVHATDALGNVDEDGEPDCFDPITGNFFEPLCAVSAAGMEGGGDSVALVGLSVVLVMFARARRRRRRPAR